MWCSHVGVSLPSNESKQRFDMLQLHNKPGDTPLSTPMAPKLAASQHQQIEGMIQSGLTNRQIVDAVGCSKRTVSRHRANLRLFNSTKAPPNRVGCRRKILPVVGEALLHRLTEQPDLYRSDMINFLREEYDVDVSLSTVTRLLQDVDWSRKISCRVGQQQNPILRDLYLYKLSDCQSHQMVFLDESGCDKQTGHRRSGRAKKGVRPSRKAKYNRERRVQVLAAYTQKGVELARVFPGSTTATVFEDFIDQLLHHCGRWPEPKPVLVMDNASIHRSERIEQMCAEAGVRLLFLAPYSPDMNPIEEFFAELKTFMRKERHNHIELYEEDFEAFVRLAVDIVGSRRASAEGHFRHSRLYVEPSPEKGYC